MHTPAGNDGSDDGGGVGEDDGGTTGLLSVPFLFWSR